MTAETSIAGQEHWTTKGDVRLFLWEKRAGATEGPLGTLLFVHGSSMASQPTFDLHILHSFLSQPAPVYRGA